MNGISSPRKIPLPNKTRWNSWSRMVFYTKDHIQYWADFFKREYEEESRNETIMAINITFQNPRKIGIITIYIHFISIYAKEFVQDLDFFKSKMSQFFLLLRVDCSNLQHILSQILLHLEIENLICRLHLIQTIFIQFSVMLFK